MSGGFLSALSADRHRHEGGIEIWGEIDGQDKLREIRCRPGMQSMFLDSDMHAPYCLLTGMLLLL